MTRKSLQERYAPASECWGCGPANPHGLRLASFPRAGSVVANWTPQRFHHAFGEYLNGGIIATVLDCHSNWTASYSIMARARLSRAPATVTANFSIEFLRPTPILPLTLRARATRVSRRSAVVRSSLSASGLTTAKFEGTFVAVREGHPAFQRWTPN